MMRKSRFSYIAFSGGFLDAPPPTHLLTPSCFGIFNVFRWYISGPSFIYVWFVVLELWKFKCFRTSKKYNFRLLLGSFLDVTHWNVVKFVWNFDGGGIYFLGGGYLIWRPCTVWKARFEEFLPAAHWFPFHIFRFKLCVTDETM